MNISESRGEINYTDIYFSGLNSISETRKPF